MVNNNSSMAAKKKVKKIAKKETKKVVKKTAVLSKPKKTTKIDKPTIKKAVPKKPESKKVVKQAVKKETKPTIKKGASINKAIKPVTKKTTKPAVKTTKKEAKPIVKKITKADKSKKPVKSEVKKETKAVIKKEVLNTKEVKKPEVVKKTKDIKKPLDKKLDIKAEKEIIKPTYLDRKVKNNLVQRKEALYKETFFGVSQKSIEIDSKIDDLEQRILEKEFEYYKTAYQVYKKKHQKGIIRQTIMVIVAGVAVALSIFLGISLSVAKNTQPIENVVCDPQNEGLAPKKEVEKIHEFTNLDFSYIYEDFKSKAYKPEDYVGQIIFESSIINEPIFQGETNDTYLRRDWQTFEYRNDGPIFMDVTCDRDFDKNIVLYGHNTPTYLDPDQDKLFTPLHLFEDPTEYDDNKYLYLALENRVEMYVVASVYQINIVQDSEGVQYLADDEPLYYLNNYTSKQFDTYKTVIEDRQYYDTYVEFDENDKLLTLQTCNENDINKLIVVAKMLDIMYY